MVRKLYIKKLLFQKLFSLFRQFHFFGCLQLPLGCDEGIRVCQHPPHDILVGDCRLNFLVRCSLVNLTTLLDASWHSSARSPTGTGFSLIAWCPCTRILCTEAGMGYQEYRETYNSAVSLQYIWNLSGSTASWLDRAHRITYIYLFILSPSGLEGEGGRSFEGKGPDGALHFDISYYCMQVKKMCRLTPIIDQSAISAPVRVLEFGFDPGYQLPDHKNP